MQQQVSGTNTVEAARYADLELACLCNLSLAWIKLGSMGKAEEACCRALLRWPSNAKALFRRGQARLALGRPLEAAADFQEVSLQEPANTEATKMLHRAREGSVRRAARMPPKVGLEAQQRRGVHDFNGLKSSPFLAGTSGGGEDPGENKKHGVKNSAMLHEATTDLLASSGYKDGERIPTTYLRHYVASGSPTSGRGFNASEEAHNHSRPEGGSSADNHEASSFMVFDWLNSAAREEAEQKVMDKRKPLSDGDVQQDVSTNIESCDDNNAAIDAKNGGGDASVSRLVFQLKARRASKQQQKKSSWATRTPKEESEWLRLKAEEMENVQIARLRYQGLQAAKPANAVSGRVTYPPENACTKKGGEPSSGEAVCENRTAMQTSLWASLVEEENQVRDVFRAKLCIGKKNTKKKNAVSRMRAEVPP